MRRNLSTTAAVLGLCLSFGSACTFEPSGIAPSDDDGDGGVLDAMLEPIDAAPIPDAPEAPPPDARPVDATGCDDLLPFQPSNFDPCQLDGINDRISLLEPFNPDILNTAYRIDTDTGVLSRAGVTIATLTSTAFPQEDAPELLVIAASSFELGPVAALGVDGDRALALVSTENLTIAGLLSAGAAGEGNGPGGDNAAACGSNGRGRNGGNQDGGGSGGGGGAFADIGGTGAVVDDVNRAEPTPGGQASGEPTLVPLRGGCGGGNGGFDGNGSGRGGGAGGALQLVAGGDLIVQPGAIVTARGGGGLGVHRGVGVVGVGGGGGGSGGGLLLEATAVRVNGFVTANGGAGGEGAVNGSNTDDGQNGIDNATTRAAGGAGTSRGGDGGAGGSANDVRGANGLAGDSNRPDLAGGGGGGGSVGRIHVRSLVQPLDRAGGLFSPEPQ